MALKFTEENFTKEVLQAQELVVVDFYADWCGPCQMMGPVIEELAEQYQGVVKIGKLNTDENQELAGKYKIMSIPSILFFKNGEVVEFLNGVTSKEEMEQKIEAKK